MKRQRIRYKRGTLKIMSLAAALSLSTALLINCEAQTEKPGAAPPFSIILQAPTTSYKAGGPIELSLTITNTSASPIGLIAGPGAVELERHFYIWATRADGTTVKESQYCLEIHQRRRRGRNALGSESTYLEIIAPGESVHHEIDANKLCDLSAPGTYNITVQRDYERDPGLVVKSNQITITVNP